MQAMLWKMVEMDLELLAAHRRLGSLKIPRAPVASLLQLNCLGPIHRTTTAFCRSKQA